MSQPESRVLLHQTERLPCPECAYERERTGANDIFCSSPECGVPEPTVRKRCCGVIYEHGGLTSARPCHDCPEAR